MKKVFLIPIIAVIALLVLVQTVIAGFNGPSRPDGLKCQKLPSLIAHTLEHQTKYGDWFYSFDKSFTSTASIPAGFKVSMYDADYPTTVQFGDPLLDSNQDGGPFIVDFNTGNEKWSDWWSFPSPEGFEGHLVVTVPITKPSSNLCFNWSAQIPPVPTSYAEATPASEPTPEATATVTEFPSHNVVSVTVWITASAPVATVESWVPTSLDDENEFSLSEIFIPGVLR